MRSLSNGLWCWDTTTQAASDDAPSQRRGWTAAFSCSFAVRVRQGRLTLPCKSIRGVRGPNTSPPLRSVRSEYSMSIIQVYLPFRAPHSRGKNHHLLLVHRWKTILMLHDLAWAQHPRVLSMKPFHIFLRVLHTFGRFPSILDLRPGFPFYKVPKLFHRFIPPSNQSRVGPDLTLDDPSYLGF